VIETGIAVLVLLFLLLLALPGIGWQLAIGTALVAIGLGGGGFAGIVYHHLLRRSLVRLGESTRGWLWTPVSRHAALDEHGRRKVLPWFRAGAAGFLLCLAGIAMLAVALLRASLGG